VEPEEGVMLHRRLPQVLARPGVQVDKLILFVLDVPGRLASVPLQFLRQFFKE
jgi:hypothetical protein